MRKARTLAILITAALAGACSLKAQPSVIEVYKAQTCGCCSAWVEHLRQNGFEVRVTSTENVAFVSGKLGVPLNLRACHTATVGGYYVEGHVPASDIKKLLRESPAIAGLAVPGMPEGSPGMEHGSINDNYATLSVDRDGRSRLFVRHPATDSRGYNS